MKEQLEQKKLRLIIFKSALELAQIIYNIHNDLSITSILTDKSRPVKLLEKKLKVD